MFKNTSNNRRNKRRRLYSTIDITAEREADAINKMRIIGNVQQPRINITYRCGSYVFRTGKRHRKIG